MTSAAQFLSGAGQFLSGESGSRMAHSLRLGRLRPGDQTARERNPVRDDRGRPRRLPGNDAEIPKLADEAKQGGPLDLEGGRRPAAVPAVGDEGVEHQAALEGAHGFAKGKVVDATPNWESCRVSLVSGNVSGGTRGYSNCPSHALIRSNTREILATSLPPPRCLVPGLAGRSSPQWRPDYSLSLARPASRRESEKRRDAAVEVNDQPPRDAGGVAELPDGTDRRRWTGCWRARGSRRGPEQHSGHCTIRGTSRWLDDSEKLLPCTARQRGPASTESYRIADAAKGAA